MKQPLIVGLALVLGIGACRAPIGVRETGFAPVYQARSRNVLDEGTPSERSWTILAYFGLDGRYRDEPEEVIAELEAIASRERHRGMQVGIAELHYDVALARRDRSRFLAAAIHAYLYLFGEEFAEPPNPYSPRFRLACDLYNRSLARALLDRSGRFQLAAPTSCRMAEGGHTTFGGDCMTCTMAMCRTSLTTDRIK